MSIEGTHWPAEATNRIPGTSARSLVEDLRRAAYGEVPLGAAFLTLDHWQEEQARAAADLLERESWALTTILAASGPVWEHLASRTLRFDLDPCEGRGAYHLEVGYFTHLAALTGPSAGEQELVAATSPVWARVYTHQDRQLAGQTGALACAYVPISTEEAVATLGFERILARIEAATRTAGQALLERARAQREREERLAAVDRELGWEPDPLVAPAGMATTVRSRAVQALLGQEGWGRPAAGAALVGAAAVLLWLLIGMPHVVLTLMVAASCLLAWRYLSTP